MTKITFYIARHGKTLMNTLDMVQGWCDSPLTDEGVSVAKDLGLGLKNIEFRTAYCSTLRRTRQTAEIILEAKQQHIPIIEMEGFKEACFGSFEAGPNKLMWGNAALFLQYTSFAEMEKDIIAKKATYDDALDVIKKLDTLGLAEDAKMLRSRTQSALRQVAEDEAKKREDANILIIAHGMSILGMLGSLGGYDLLKTGHLDNASVCKVIYENGDFTIETMGDLSYVDKGKLLRKLV